MNRRMRRLLSLAIASVLLLSLIAPVSADVSHTTGGIDIGESTDEQGRVPVTSVTISGGTSQMSVGETTGFSASFLPKNARDVQITWSSSDTSVLKVNSFGMVTAVGDGEATITAAALNGVKDSVSITVYTPVNNKLEVSPEKLIMRVGETYRPTVDASSKIADLVTWSSSKSSVAAVDRSTGLITAVKAGSAKITASADNLNSTVSVTVYQTPLSLSLVQKGEQCKVTYTNTSCKEYFWGYLYLALYEDGKMITGTSYPITLESNASQTQTLPLEMKTGKAYTAVAYVLDQGYSPVQPCQALSLSNDTVSGEVDLEQAASATASYQKFTAEIPHVTAQQEYLFFVLKDNSGILADDKVVYMSQKAPDDTSLAFTACLDESNMVGTYYGFVISNGVRTDLGDFHTVMMDDGKIVVTKVTVSGPSAMFVSDKKKFSCGITPLEAGTDGIVWSSSDTSVLTVGKTTGSVTAVGEGTATITATVPNGVKGKRTVTVSLPVVPLDVAVRLNQPTQLTVDLKNSTTYAFDGHVYVALYKSGKMVSGQIYQPAIAADGSQTLTVAVPGQGSSDTAIVYVMDQNYYPVQGRTEFSFSGASTIDVEKDGAAVPEKEKFTVTLKEEDLSSQDSQECLVFLLTDDSNIPTNDNVVYIYQKPVTNTVPAASFVLCPVLDDSCTAVYAISLINGVQSCIGSFQLNLQEEEFFGADLNGDEIINADDLALLTRHIAKIKLLEGDVLRLADINGDGKVDVADLSLMSKSLGGNGQV